MHPGLSTLRGANGGAVAALAPVPRTGWGLAEVAHDARSMVTALGLYCELLAEPGVLPEAHLHYVDELRLVAAASRRLVEKLTMIAELTGGADSARAGSVRPAAVTALPGTGVRRLGGRLPNQPIENLMNELEANRHLLGAMAGVGVKVTVKARGGARAVRLSGEDLTRVLVNLVKNAAEAMPGTGSIHITLHERRGEKPRLLLTIEDSGPGIPEASLATIFEPGCTTRVRAPGSGWPKAHRGLGLSITQSIVTAAGGSICASNRPGGGARFQIELPVRL